MRVTAEDAVSGDHERGKVSALEAAGGEVLPLLLFLSAAQGIRRRLLGVSASVEVGNLDVNDGVGATRPEATDEEITTGLVGILVSGGGCIGIVAPVAVERQMWIWAA